MEFIIKTNLDNTFRTLCNNAVFPCINRLSDKIESLKYFVIGDSETDTFIETIAEYSAILHTESHAENTQMYQVAAKTLEGTDENGEYCQAIIVKSGLLIGFVTDLFSLNDNIAEPNYTDMQWLGLTTIVHEIGHAVDNQFIYKIRDTVNTRSAFDLNNPDDREEYILLSCISIWSEYFAESFVYDSFPMLRDKVDDDTNNLIECAKNYYGQNIYAADRVYRIIYFFVHLLAQKGEACYNSLFATDSPLICYKDYLLNIGSELTKLKNVYPHWNIDTDLSSLQQNYANMLIFEKTRRR